MERLTRRDISGCPFLAKDPGYLELLDRLAAYEDTGLEPWEIKSLLAEWKVNLMALDSYRKDESEGRLVVLPCKVGDHLFRVCYAGTDRAFISDFQETVEPFGVPVKDLFGGYKLIALDEFGKTVFFTIEEAKAALEKETRE